jgi:AcrR family transcriptional regulator
VSAGTPDSLRHRILDAAEAVVVRQGIANLALEAVAARAGISKGGLLYHFPSKDRLVEAMVARCADHWRAGVLAAFERAVPGPGRMARALLSQLEDARCWTEQCQQSSSAVFAALAQNPRLIEPLRTVYGELRSRLDTDGLPAGVGELILVALDGLWLNRVLGLSRVDASRLDVIRRELELLVSRAPHARPPARRDSPRPKRGVKPRTLREGTPAGAAEAPRGRTAGRTPRRTPR